MYVSLNSMFTRRFPFLAGAEMLLFATKLAIQWIRRPPYRPFKQPGRGDNSFILSTTKVQDTRSIISRPCIRLHVMTLLHKETLSYIPDCFNFMYLSFLLNFGCRICLNFFNGSTALCWALAVFQFLNLIYRRQDSLNGGSARRKAST
jgi:hypothetical protein